MNVYVAVRTAKRFIHQSEDILSGVHFFLAASWLKLQAQGFSSEAKYEPILTKTERQTCMCVSPHVDDVSFSAAVLVLVQHDVTVSSVEPTHLTLVQQNLQRAFHTPHVHTQSHTISPDASTVVVIYFETLFRKCGPPGST